MVDATARRSRCATYTERVDRMIAVIVGTLLAAGLAGCGSRVDRGAYVKANERLFKQLPSFPGARLESETATAYRSSESGPVVGYSTRFDHKLPAAATAANVSSFFRGRLRPRWRLVEAIDGPVFNFRSGKASVSINLENAQVHILEIAVDHAYYGRLGR
jgi:hypothetical protein